VTFRANWEVAPKFGILTFSEIKFYIGQTGRSVPLNVPIRGRNGKCCRTLADPRCKHEHLKTKISPAWLHCYLKTTKCKIRLYILLPHTILHDMCLFVCSLQKLHKFFFYLTTFVISGRQFAERVVGGRLRQNYINTQSESCN
jgi:hypothetical protein